MLKKDSPEVQDLLNRIQQVVPGLTGPVGNLWDHHIEVGIEMTYDQEPPTAMLREFRPGHYGLVVLYDHEDKASPSIWEVSDYGCGVWYIPFTPEDEPLLKAIMNPTNSMRDTGSASCRWL